MTRRQLLGRGGALLLAAGFGPAVLSACGVTPEEVGQGQGKATGGIGGPVDFLSWEGYDMADSKTMSKWRQENGVEVRPTYIGVHDDIQAKLKSGSTTSYDLISYFQGYVEQYGPDNLDILTTLDDGKIGNIDQLFPIFKEGATSEQFWKVDGKRYGVPIFWSATTLDYRTDLKDAPTSWRDLLEPEFKGKVGWVPDANAAYNIGGLMLGLTPPRYTREEFHEISALLRKMRGQTRGFAPSFGDLSNQLVSGEVIATFAGWAAIGVGAKGKGVEINSIVPEEGSYTSVDAFAVPPTADNAETVHAFINEALTPKVQAEAAESLASGIVNPAAVELMSEEARNIYPYDDLDAFFEKTPMYPFPPLDEESAGGSVTRDEWLDEWSKIQAGS